MGVPLIGHEPVSGLYYEVLGPAAGQVPLLFIHGGGATGACFRSDLRSGPGWADLLAQRGHRCWVTDWPGTGRSGNTQPLEQDYSTVVDGYRRLLREVICEPVVVVCHSMGGAVAWQLVAHETDLVAGVIGLGAAYPANVAPTSEVVSDDGRVIEVIFADTGVRFRVDRQAMYLYEDAYIFDQAIATSTRFPRDRVGDFRAGLVGLAPTMVLQRLGVIEGMPTVDDPASFDGMPVVLVAGGEDPAHTRDIEDRTVELFNSWGAEARLVWLPDRGLDGFGHFFFVEDGAEAVLEEVAVEAQKLGAGPPQTGSESRS